MLVVFIIILFVAAFLEAKHKSAQEARLDAEELRRQQDEEEEAYYAAAWAERKRLIEQSSKALPISKTHTLVVLISPEMLG
jgi:Flp pilus assembly protein TadB